MIRAVHHQHRSPQWRPVVAASAAGLLIAGAFVLLVTLGG